MPEALQERSDLGAINNEDKTKKRKEKKDVIHWLTVSSSPWGTAFSPRTSRDNQLSLSMIPPMTLTHLTPIKNLPV